MAAEVEEQVSQGQTEAPEGQGPESVSQPKVFDESYVKQLRNEAASYRTKVKALEEKVAAFETERMTEAERMKADAKAAKEQARAAQEALRQARAEAAITKAANRYNVDPELLGKLIPVEFNDDGQPNDVDAAVKELLKTHGYLVKGVGLSPTNPARQTVPTLEEMKTWSPETMQARLSEAQEAMRRHSRT